MRRESERAYETPRRLLKMDLYGTPRRLLNMDFEQEIDQILKVIPRDRHTQLFSATMTSKVQKLQRACLQVMSCGLCLQWLSAWSRICHCRDGVVAPFGRRRGVSLIRTIEEDAGIAPIETQRGA